MSTTQPTADIDRYGRPLPERPDARRVETDPIGVHVIRMHRPAQFVYAQLAGAGVPWYHANSWESEHVITVPGRMTASGRWRVGYLDDGAIVNHGEGRERTHGRSAFMYELSSCISADPDMGTAADIRRDRAAGLEHAAQLGDLVILQCFDPGGVLVETVACTLVPDGHIGRHLTLRLVQRT